ncbi:MAG: HNH endonuclease [Pseudobdellovibrionaceae bacterium]
MSSSLKDVTNTELEVRLKDLVHKERKLLHVILEHIKEVDTRKLYLEKAYSSLYEYLVKECGYSGSAAMRRLEAARLLKEIPAVAEKIQQGSLNLSQIGELSKIIKKKERQTGSKINCLQKQELVSKISGKTTFETQKELSLALNIPIKENEVQRFQKDDSVRIEMTFTKKQFEKLLQCKDLAAHLIHQEHKDSSWASLIEILADQYLKSKLMRTDKKETAQPKKINKIASTDETDKRNETEGTDETHKINIQDNIDTKAANKVQKMNAKNHINKNITTKRDLNSCVTAPAIDHKNININIKSITTKTRREILARDGCCQFVDSLTGKKCESTYGLQVDHKMSRWAGGDNSFSNLTVLCFHHNQHKYKQEANIRTL